MKRKSIIEWCLGTVYEAGLYIRKSPFPPRKSGVNPISLLIIAAVERFRHLRLSTAILYIKRCQRLADFN